MIPDQSLWNTIERAGIIVFEHVSSQLGWGFVIANYDSWSLGIAPCDSREDALYQALLWLVRQALRHSGTNGGDG